VTHILPIALGFALALAEAQLVLPLRRPRQSLLRKHVGLAIGVSAGAVALVLMHVGGFPAMHLFGSGVL
jgi:hypothetical protein